MYKINMIVLSLIALISLSLCWSTASAQVSDEMDTETIIAGLQDDAQKAMITYHLSSLSASRSVGLMFTLIKALDTNDAKSRVALRLALNILQENIVKDETAINDVLNLLNKDDLDSKDSYYTNLRGYAREIFTRIGPKAIPSLLDVIQSRSGQTGLTRVWAGLIISEIDGLSEAQLDTLNGILTNRDEDNRKVKLWAAVTLANNKRKSQEIALAAFYELSDSSPYYRMNAALTLEKMGDLNKPYTNELFGALERETEVNYKRRIRAYEENQSYIKSKLARKEELTFAEENAHSRILNELENSATVRAALVRILATHGSRQDELVKTLIYMLRVIPFQPRSYTAYSLAPPEITFGISSYNFEFPELSVLPAFKSLGSHAVAPLLSVYNAEPDERIRVNTIIALGYVGEPAKEALPLLFKDLYGAGNRRVIQSEAIKAIGLIGSADPQKAIPKLVEVYKSRTLNQDILAAEALETIAERLADTDEGVKFIGLLKDAHKEFDGNDREVVQKSAADVRRAISLLTDRWWKIVFQRKIFAYGKYFLPFILLLLLWLALLVWRPYYLFKINQKLSKLPFDYKIYGVVGGPLRYLLLVGFFHYRPRVLDAWLKKHVENTRTRFASRHLVKERDRYVPVPVEFDDKKLTGLTPGHLKPFFKSTTVALMVTGEGGIGKTSLACLIGKWAIADDEDHRLCDHYLLPILIEQDAEILFDNNINVVERAIQLQLKAYTQENDFPSSELVHHLLKHKRLLIVIDGVSEIEESLRRKIMVDVTKLPTNALILTSRHGEYLEDYAPATVQPMKISGGFLADFLGTYFTEQKIRQSFDDEEFFDVCRRMSLLSNNREVTALLVKLFADLIVAIKLKIAKDYLPQNLPDLVLSYLNYLNRDFDKGETSNENIHQAAKKIAWECLKNNFYPTQALTADVLKALGGDEKASNLLDHLERKLNLIQRDPVSRARVRFSLEPLAEYLACMHAIEIFQGSNDLEWKELFAKLKSNKQGVVVDRIGFIHALQDCCSTKYSDHVPPFVLKDIAKLSGIRLENQKKKNAQKRVGQIIQDLKILDPEDLLRIKQEVSLQEHKINA